MKSNDNFVKVDPSISLHPTIGFSNLSFRHVKDFETFDIHLYDIGGRKGIRGIWGTYYAEVNTNRRRRMKNK